jgi:prepilin-type processing-associated H-X9-DG protein
MSKKNSTLRVSTHFMMALVLLFILASILIPTTGAVYGGPHINVSANNLSQIAKTYNSYSYASNPARMLRMPPGSTVHDAAFILAKDAGLNDASVWFILSDDALAGVTIPKSVIDANLTTIPNWDFMHTQLSVVIAANISTSAPSTTTPIAWDRGLQENGKWSRFSPWKGTGGHIAFLDGHVEWFDSLNTADPSSSLVVASGWPNAGTATVNITEALPPGAVILSAEPRSNRNF